jgi:hypothetical protein
MSQVVEKLLCQILGNTSAKSNQCHKKIKQYQDKYAHVFGACTAAAVISNPKHFSIFNFYIKQFGT